MIRIRYGLDTNVLIYAHMPALAEHEAVRVFLTELARRDDTLLAVTPSVLHEFVHVVTDGRRFDPPVAMPEATAIARRYLDRSNVACVAVTEEAMTLALDLVDRHRLGRKRIADTLLAAIYLHLGIDTLVTCDPGDFEIFDGLRIVDPRADRP